MCRAALVRAVNHGVFRNRYSVRESMARVRHFGAAWPGRVVTKSRGG
jgi:hypothetical protein